MTGKVLAVSARRGHHFSKTNALEIRLIAGLGVDAYRFSVSWPRVRPGGAGSWNAKGLDFYERLVDGMLQRGLKPRGMREAADRETGVGELEDEPGNAVGLQ